MEGYDEFHCLKCGTEKHNNKQNRKQNTTNTNYERNAIFCTKLSFKQTSSTKKQNINYYTGFLILILGLLYMVNAAESQIFADEFDTEVLSEDTNNIRMSNNTPLNMDPSPVSIANGPRVQEVGKGRKYKKCPKDFRKTFCLNGGRCHWVEEIGTGIATCRCKRNWMGTRCQDPRIDFTADDEENNNIIIIVASVLSAVVFLALIAIFCICWRRMKSVQKELEMEEIENQQKLISENENGSTHSANVIVSS